MLGHPGLRVGVPPTRRTHGIVPELPRTNDSPVLLLRNTWDAPSTRDVHIGLSGIDFQLAHTFLGPDKVQPQTLSLRND